MKQNQSLFRPFPGEKTQLKHHDFLKFGASCKCSMCGHNYEVINPEIYLDQQLMLLRKNYEQKKGTCHLILFLSHLKKSGRLLPKFQFLDTLVMSKGEGEYAVVYEEGRMRIIGRVGLKNFVLDRKGQMDLQYQKRKHQRQNKGFSFVQFGHESEKKIKQFQANIKYTSSMLNRVAILKLNGDTEQKILTKSQFLDLFNIGKSRYCQLEDIQYVQVFPIMYGEEEHSYVKTIKYFHAQEFSKKSFKLAQVYVSTWKQRNQSLQSLQQKVHEQIKGDREIAEEDRLLYQTYKLFIFFQDVSNCRIEEAVIEYITNDGGLTFYLKKIDCMRLEHKIAVNEIGSELPRYKQIPLDEHINLRVEMRVHFDRFQEQFDRLEQERMEMETKIKKDKEYSNYVFKTITGGKGDNFHKVLLSSNQKYKKTQLSL